MNCETLSLDEVSQVLGVCRMTAYRLARSGEIPALRLGRRLRVPKVVLEQMLRNPSGKREEVSR